MSAVILSGGKILGSGGSVYSTGTQATLVFDFPDFSGSPNISLAGASISSNELWTVLQNAGHKSGGAWYNSLLTISTFTTQFTFQFVGASGVTVPTVFGGLFVIQNSTSPPGASGFTGIHGVGDANVAGYGLYQLGGQFNNMTPSIGVKFDLNTSTGNAVTYPSGGGSNSTGLYLNSGPYAGLTPAQDITPYGINFYNGNVLSCTIVYDGSLLTMVLEDTITAAQARYQWPLNLSDVLTQGYVGFTGGAVSSNVGMAIQSWSFYNGYNTRLSTPTISPASGQYGSSQTVTISGPGTIYYTTNGLLPTAASTLYTGGFTVSSNTIVQAVSIQSGFTDSLVASNVYQIGTSLIVNCGSGFTSGDGVIPVGRSVYSGSAIQLTDTNNATNGNEVGAMWWGAPLPINVNFTTNFQIQLTSAQAQGMCFVLQNFQSASTFSQPTTQASSTNGPTAFGGGSQGMGYGGLQGTGTGSPGIPASVAVKFDVFGNGSTQNLTGLYTDGATPGGSSGSSVSPVSLASGHPLNVSLSYNAGTQTLSMSITDTVNSNNFSTSFSINIPGTIGSNSAYAGFTAGTGGEFGNFIVNNWTW